MTPAVYDLRLGEVRVIGGVEVQFAEVISDTRCPTDVTCVQQGTAVIGMNVGPYAGTRGPTYHVELDTSRRTEGEAMGLRLVLVQVLPAPLSSGSPKADEYRAVLRIGSAYARWKIRAVGEASPSNGVVIE